MKQINEFLRGVSVFPRGVRWLVSHPFYMLLLATPVFLGLMLLLLSWQHLTVLDQWFLNHLLFSKPDAWYLVWIWVVLKYSLIFLIRVIAIMLMIVSANIIWVPIYEWVSCAIEAELTGNKAEGISLWKSFLLLKEEIKKFAFIFFLSILSLFIFNAIGVIVAAFLIGWDLWDYPLARRGWGFRQRLKFTLLSWPAVLGLGLWLMIPFVQFFVYPLAIVGGTILNIETLKNKNLLGQQATQD